MVIDDSYFAYIATLDEGDAWDDEAVWIKANPALGGAKRIAKDLNHYSYAHNGMT